MRTGVILAIVLATVIVVPPLAIVVGVLIGANESGDDRGAQRGAAFTAVDMGAGLFEGRTAQWTVLGRVAGVVPGDVDLQLEVKDWTGLPAPAELRIDLQFEMRGHSMPALIGRLERIGDGRYRANANLPMSGDWQVLVTLPDGTIKTAIDSGTQR